MIVKTYLRKIGEKMKKAILIMTYGSPEEYTFEGIATFFTNIRRGRRPKDEEIQHLLDNYLLIKGSPLQEITLKTVELFKEKIDNNYNVYFANKFSNPFIPDIVKQMEEDGIEECICLILEPHYSIYSIMGYERFLNSDKIKFNLIKEWYDNDYLLNYWVEEINKIIATLENDSYKVIFTAHSVPEIAKDYGDPYISQVEQMIATLAEKLQLKKENYTNAWQSESDIGMPWIKPDVLEYLKEQSSNPNNYIFVPVSFISDHIETLFDNDVECKELCDEYNVNYFRPPMPNYDERLIMALISTVKKHENDPFVFLNGEEHTFNEMQSPKDDLKMPDFVKKLIAKKGKENVKMPKHIRKMLEKAGRLPKK